MLRDRTAGEVFHKSPRFPRVKVPDTLSRAVAKHRSPLILLALVAATLAVFWQVGECGFVAFDDPAYVRDNMMVNQGLRPAAICWAFTAPHAGNWHPLTSLSHMLDCTLFDRAPAPMHWENLGWHLLNVTFVFALLRRLFPAELWPAVVVAGLFALHPLRVESVAWISERKDVLSTALWLATLLAYLRWVERPSRRNYGAVALGFTLALMAKPMAVTLPGTLLLLDFWPLRRWPARSWGALFREKLPLFVLAILGSVLTVWFQRESGAAEYGARFSLAERAANALVSYVRYLGKTVWPEPLAPFYPHPGSWPWGTVLGSAVLLLAVSGLAWRERERRPWLLFGWGWFLGTLLPTIGLLQVGAQSMADRYTYLPLLGIFIVLGWGGAELARRRTVWQAPIAVVAVLVLVGCAVRTMRQVSVWKTPLSLVEHLHAVVGDDPFVRRLQGRALVFAGRAEKEVAALYRGGLTAAPESPFFPHELAVQEARRGNFAEARKLLERVQTLRPEQGASFAALGSVAEMEGHLAEAETHYRRSLALDPRAARVHRLLGANLLRQARKAEARDACREAVRLDRWDTVALHQLGVIHAELGEAAEARACFERALWINPRDGAVAKNLERLNGKNRR